MNSKKSITVNAFLNTIRQICTIIFPLITLPYASRVLEKANYGKINFATSYISYFSILAALGISTYAIREGAPLRDEKNKINNFCNQVFSINIMSTLVAYIALFTTLTVSETLQKYKALIIIYSFGIVLTTIGVEWLYSIYEDYLFVTIRSIITQVLSLVLMFLFVKRPEDFYIYAIINVIANGGANVFSFIFSHKYVKLKFTIKMNLRKHLKPMLILLGNAIAIVIYVNSDTTILGFLKDDNVVGIYSVAVKIYTGVKQLLNAILTVSIPRIAIYLSEHNDKKYNALLSNIIETLLLILVPVMVAMFYLSDDLIVVVAGEAYRSGGLALRILSIALSFSIGAGFFSNAVLITNKCESKVLTYTLIAAGLNVGLNFALIPSLSQNGAAFTTMLAEMFVFISCWLSSRKYCKLLISQTDIISIFLGSAGVILVCILGNMLFLNIFIKLLFDVIVSVVVYAIVLYFMKNKIFIYYINKI